MTRRRSLLRREPFGALLVAANLILAAVLLRRFVRAPASAGLPPGHPDVAVPAAIEAALTAPALDLRGVVERDPRLKEPWPEGAVVFVVARGAAGGPPYAVRRYDGARPPFAWSLGPGDAMLGGRVPATLRVSVRVDQDGDAATRQLGDLEGGPSAPVSPRGSLTLTVDRPAALVPPGSL